MEISKKLYNANCTSKYFFVEKYFESWDPKIHCPRNYLQIFYVAAHIERYGTKKHCPLAAFKKWYIKKTRSSYKGTVIDGAPYSSSDSKMASKIKGSFKRIFVKNVM